MRLSDLEWGEPETGGPPKAAYSVAEARFSWQGNNFVAVEWYRRTGHSFHPYASLVLIAAECDKTADGDLLRRIAFGAAASEPSASPRLVRSETLGRQVVLIEDPDDRDIDLSDALGALA